MASITLKTQRRQIQFVDKGLDDTDRIVLSEVVVQTFRQQYELASVLALDKTLHPSSPRTSPPAKYQI